MDHKKIARNTGENSVRIEQIIHLASMCNSDSMPDEVEDAFNQDWEEVWQALEIEPIDDGMDIETISIHLYESNKQGFLIQAATPCPTGFSEDGKAWSTNGWGMYTMEWFYVDEFNDVFPLIEKWKVGYIESQREKGMKELAA